MGDISDALTAVRPSASCREEQVMMTRMNSIGLGVLVAIAIGGIAATAAQAEEAPYWSIEGTRLAAGKTAEITAKAVGNQVLTAGPVTMTCTGLELLKGAVLLGSNAGEPGKSDETIQYTGCTQTGGGSPCKIVLKAGGEEGKITTEPLTNELAYAENKKSLVEVFAPASKKKLAVLHFEGTGCTVTEAPVEGVAVVGVYTDVSGSAGVLLELPNAVAQAKSFILKLNGVSTTNIWLIKGGTGSAVTTEELTYDGTRMALAGEALILLATNGVSNEKLWSPLLSAAAQPEEAPYWSIEGTRLAAGKTSEIDAKAVGNQILSSGEDAVACAALKLKEGAVLLGSNSTEPGKGDATIEYSECTVTGNGSPCEVTSGKVTTEPLTSELAYAENKKSLVVQLSAASNKTLAVIHFTGSGCKITESPVDGVAVTGVYTDAEPPVLLELPTAVTQAESFLLKLDGKSKTNIWLIKGGTGVARTTEEVTFNGTEAKLEGTILVSLASRKKWSPLL
jgi:hypothetical protein